MLNDILSLQFWSFWPVKGESRPIALTLIRIRFSFHDICCKRIMRIWNFAWSQQRAAIFRLPFIAFALSFCLTTLHEPVIGLVIINHSARLWIVVAVKLSNWTYVLIGDPALNFVAVMVLNDQWMRRQCRIWLTTTVIVCQSCFHGITWVIAYSLTLQTVSARTVLTKARMMAVWETIVLYIKGQSVGCRLAKNEFSFSIMRDIRR